MNWFLDIIEIFVFHWKLYLHNVSAKKSSLKVREKFWKDCCWKNAVINTIVVSQLTSDSERESLLKHFRSTNELDRFVKFYTGWVFFNTDRDLETPPVSAKLLKVIFGKVPYSWGLKFTFLQTTWNSANVGHSPFKNWI